MLRRLPFDCKNLKTRGKKLEIQNVDDINQTACVGPANGDVCCGLDLMKSIPKETYIRVRNVW